MLLVEVEVPDVEVAVPLAELVVAVPGMHCE